MIKKIINYYSFHMQLAGAPYDGSPEEVIHNYNIILAGFYYVFAFLGLICAVVCLIFNILFRNKKYVL